MKKTAPFIFIVLALAGATATSAQSPSPSPSNTSAHSTPQGDPFVKKQQTAAAADAGNPANICFTVEIYALTQADAAKLLEENPGDEARHARMLELAGNGKARLETLLSNVTKSGQRSVLEQNDEVRYPTELEPSHVHGEPMFPIKYESSNAGETMEFEPVLSPDKSVCDINLALTSMRFHGFSDIRAREQDTPVAQPQFESRKLITSLALVTGRTQFLGTLSAPPRFADAGAEPQVPQEVRLVFGRVGIVAMAPVTSPEQEETGTLEHQLSFYSMDREAARQILAGDPKPGAYYDAVRVLVEKQQARLERISILKTKSGQRSVVVEVNQVRYATEYFLGHDDGANSPQTLAGLDYQPGSFETRNVGLTLEIEPVANKSIVDLNMAPMLVSDIGNLQAAGVAAKYPPQPVFESNKVNTSLSAPLGQYAFISTFSPAGDTGVNGKKDTGRVWFAFIRTAYARP